MNGRIESQCTLTGAEVKVDIGGGMVTVPLIDGDYYPPELLAMLEAEIESTLGVGFTVTTSFLESGTGQWGLAKNTGTFVLQFQSGLSPLFGVAGKDDWNVAPATSYTSAAGMLGMWLPDAPMSNVDILTDGFLTTNAGYLKSPGSGDLSLRVGAGHYRHRDITWSHVRRPRAVDGASSSLVSWGQFVRETQFGGNTYFPHSIGGYPPRVRVFRDATAGLLLGTGDGEYRMKATRDLAMPRPVNEFLAYYTVVIPELVKL